MQDEPNAAGLARLFAILSSLNRRHELMLIIETTESLNDSTSVHRVEVTWSCTLYYPGNGDYFQTAPSCSGSKQSTSTKGQDSRSRSVPPNLQDRGIHDSARSHPAIFIPLPTVTTGGAPFLYFGQATPVGSPCCDSDS